MRYLVMPAIVALFTASTTPALAQVQIDNSQDRFSLVESLKSGAAPLSQFTPRPSSNRRIDFQAWDGLLKDMVFYGGPSLRKFSNKPDPVTGTRFVYGHTSPYRMEGNRVVFDTMDDTYIGFIKQYIDDLVDIGNRVDIAALQKDQQLSYWLNLHNAVVIHAIASEYPVYSPSKIKGEDGSDFQDTKRVTISGADLSLRDIREGIVFENWSDPLVIYGFFHGTIGSPSIQRTAYTADTIRQTLRFSALEYANSLRGFHVRQSRAYVSRHYQEAAPYFFPNFETDLRAHLTTLLDPPVAEELSQSRGDFKIIRYSDDIADLSKGDPYRQPSSPVLSVGREGVSGFAGTTLERALREHNEKFREIRRRGLFGTVTIEDIETVPDRSDGNTVE